MFNFSEKVAIITGATGNLGSAVTRRLIAAGARVVIADLSEKHQRELYADLVGLDEHFLASPVDMAEPASVARMVDETMGRFGQIDILVNGVGGYRAGAPLHETPVDTWDFMVKINARTVFVGSQAVIPHMLERGQGKIINIAARPGLQGAAGMAAYAASKSAVIRLTESMADELRANGINVNCILPGTLDTPQNRTMMPDADFSQWVTPESLTDVILFLASHAARDVHGATLPVYGQS
ncbi:MAG: SDR family oxidoreductase [Caldilineaceae bacterium]|nr:SDR family oxidoreductase [Caldilineaceae bacterium]